MGLVKLHAILDLYWTMHTAVSSMGHVVALAESKRRPGEFRVVHTSEKATRWRISQPLNREFAEQVIDEARRDIMRSHFDLRSMRHMLGIHARQTIKGRLVRHRAKMGKIREQKAMSALSNFGMF